MFNQLTLKTSYSDEYFIKVGYDVKNEVIEFLKQSFSTNKIIVIIDENVDRAYGDGWFDNLRLSFKNVVKCVVPPGENSKSFATYNQLMDSVLLSGIERKTPLLAIGGGVTGDLAGYVAASVLRGIPLIHVPTTLLAMVDSSIGGKTGINHSTGKNLIGAFYQPKAVFSDLKFLESLPEKEWVSGISEILKYGFINDPSIFEELKDLTNSGVFDAAKKWKHIVEKSASIKVHIVARDVKESGMREFLNFGHTFAHVLEKVGNYKEYSHGEAVYVGMWAAVFASNRLGSDIDTSNLKHFKSLYDISESGFRTDTEKLVSLMQKDKKVQNEMVRLVLLKSLGQPYTQLVTDSSILHDSWNFTKEIFG